jgi:hypothetical protein
MTNGGTTMTAALATEQVIVQRILDHIDRKTTDLADGIWREPVENYTSQARFGAEIVKVFRRVPTAFCPSAALPEVGSYVARDAALTRSSPFAVAMALCARSATPAAIAAFRSSTAQAARRR